MHSLSIFQKIQLGIIGISLSSMLGVITTKNLSFLIAPLLLEPTTLYLVSKERQQNSKKLSDKESEFKKALRINEDSQKRLNAEKIKLESDIQNLQNEIQILKIDYEEKIKVFNDQLLNSVPKEVISAFIDQARLLSEMKENLEKELLIKSKENLAEQEQRKKLEDLISDLEAKNKSSLAMCFLLKNKEKQLIEKEKSLLDARLVEQQMIATLRDAKTNLQNQIQEEVITNKNLQKIIDNYQQNVTNDSYFYKLISGRTDSRNLLIQAIGESQKSLVIVCPWIKDSALNKPVNNPIKEELENALKRGVNIFIGWGYLGDANGSTKSLTRDKLLKSRSRMFYTGIKILEELQKKYPEQLRLYVLGTHEKFLVVDESYGFIGSHNFLTSDDSSTEREIGIHTNNLDIIKELLNIFNEASAKSIKESPNTFIETSVKSINSAVPKIIKPCQAAKRKKIIVPKIIVPKIVETYTEKITIEKSRLREEAQEIELEMVIVPAGSFLMGSDDTDHLAFYNEKPKHQVTLKQFAIAKYLVTQEQYQVIMETNPSRCKDNPKNPVDSITWNDAQIFCQKLSQKTGKNYRLPTESEWEYACRAGTQTRYYFGDNERLLDKYAWCYHNSDSKTHPVGEKKPNNWGLYDMHGNVWEWCEDSWHEDYQNAPKDGIAWNDNPSQPNRKVLRGGSSFVYARVVRSAFRCSYDFHDGYYGFRVAISLP